MLTCIGIVELKGPYLKYKGQSMMIILTWNKFSECQYLTKKIGTNIV